MTLCLLFPSHCYFFQNVKNDLIHPRCQQSSAYTSKKRLDYLMGLLLASWRSNKSLSGCYNILYWDWNVNWSNWAKLSVKICWVIYSRIKYFYFLFKLVSEVKKIFFQFLHFNASKEPNQVICSYFKPLRTYFCGLGWQTFLISIPKS